MISFSCQPPVLSGLAGYSCRWMKIIFIKFQRYRLTDDIPTTEFNEQ